MNCISFTPFDSWIICVEHHIMSSFSSHPSSWWLTSFESSLFRCSGYSSLDSLGSLQDTKRRRVSAAIIINHNSNNNRNNNDQQNRKSLEASHPPVLLILVVFLSFGWRERERESSYVVTSWSSCHEKKPSFCPSASIPFANVLPVFLISRKKYAPKWS